MKPLVITALGETAGKTAIAVGLAMQWQQVGRRIAYLKPRFRPAAAGEDQDAAFFLQALALPAGATASPAIGSQSGQDNPAAFGQEVSRAAEAMAPADLLLVETEGQLEDQAVRERVLDTLSALDAKALLVVRYQQHLAAELVRQHAETLGDQLGGIVLNAVPTRMINYVREQVESPLRETGLPMLGILPETRALSGFTVGELTDHLHAEVLCLPEQRETLLENLMIGANPPDPAFNYFAPSQNKAVICRADRPDIQLAALDTTTRCLVLTGTGGVQTSLVYRAEDEGVTVIKVPTDTIATVERLTGLVEQIRFRQQKKVLIMTALLTQHFDVQGLSQALNVPELEVAGA